MTAVGSEAAAAGRADSGEGAESVEFLRRSLRDLDAELAAGDLSPDDHRRLRDQYTVRLARALRAGRGPAPTQAATPAPAPTPEAAGATGRPDTEAGTPDTEGGRPDTEAGRPARGTPESGTPGAGAPGRPRRRVRAALWAAAVAMVAVASGVAVARTSGTRTAGQELSGAGAARTVRQRLDGCVELAAQRLLLEAVRCYTEVLADEPSSAEAYAYRGWTLVRAGDERLWPRAGRDLDAAVALDPDYPDARVFRAVLRRGQGRLEEARADLEAFDGLAAPRLMRDLVDQLGLRQSLGAAPTATSSTAPSPTAGSSPAASAASASGG